MSEQKKGVSEVEETFDFMRMPPAKEPAPSSTECGVRTTAVCVSPVASIPSIPSTQFLYCCFVSSCADSIDQFPTIANAPLPAEGPSNDQFSNLILAGAILVVPFYLTRKVGGGLKTFIFFALITTLPILVGYWTIMSRYSPRKNTKVKLPGKPIEHYLDFHKPEDKEKYSGNAKIPMETFHEMYFAGDVSFKGDCLEVLEYRHDWCTSEFTWSLFKYFLTGMIPEVLMHTRSQGKRLSTKPPS